jgi:hypothetical protein
MQDPKKEQFILNSIERIKSLKNEIREAKKHNVDISDLMQAVQREVTQIQNEADEIFDPNEAPISEEELELYLQNPGNFSKEDWELLETIKRETASCKKEIIKAGESEAVKDLIGNRKKKKGTQGQPRKRA